jgi:hypothetical protein
MLAKRSLMVTLRRFAAACFMSMLGCGSGAGTGAAAEASDAAAHDAGDSGDSAPATCAPTTQRVPCGPSSCARTEYCYVLSGLCTTPNVNCPDSGDVSYACLPFPVDCHACPTCACAFNGADAGFFNGGAACGCNETQGVTVGCSAY